jgi:hypothetical protein
MSTFILNKPDGKTWSLKKSDFPYLIMSFSNILIAIITAHAAIVDGLYFKNFSSFN